MLICQGCDEKSQFNLLNNRNLVEIPPQFILIKKEGTIQQQQNLTDNYNNFITHKVF